MQKTVLERLAAQRLRKAPTRQAQQADRGAEGDLDLDGRVSVVSVVMTGGAHCQPAGRVGQVCHFGVWGFAVLQCTAGDLTLSVWPPDTSSQDKALISSHRYLVYRMP